MNVGSWHYWRAPIEAPMPRTRLVKSGSNRAGRNLTKAVAALRKLPKPPAVERRRRRMSHHSLHALRPSHSQGNGALLRAERLSSIDVTGLTLQLHRFHLVALAAR